MPKALKVLVSTATIALCGTALYSLCYVPILCNRVTRAMKERTVVGWNRAQRATDMYRTVVEARLRLARLQLCLNSCGAGVETHMVAAANYRLLGRFDEAVEEYRGALRLDHRPEIYFNLGLAEIAAGQREQGISDLVVAGRTGSYWNLIEDVPIRNEVTRRLFYLPAPRF